MSPVLIVVIILGAVLVYVWSVYNNLVTLKARIKASIQEVGNQLKRQTDLIPNLMESVKGYLKHEKDIFDKITKARAGVLQGLQKGDAKSLVEASNNLTRALSPIMALFESTPQLQSAAPVQSYMGELRDTADKIMYSRRTLIDLSADYNIQIATFPSNLVAGFLNFKPEAGLSTPEDSEFLTVSQSDTKTPQTKLE